MEVEIQKKGNCIIQYNEIVSVNIIHLQKKTYKSN